MATKRKKKRRKAKAKSKEPLVRILSELDIAREKKRGMLPVDILMNFDPSNAGHVAALARKGWVVEKVTVLDRYGRKIKEPAKAKARQQRQNERRRFARRKKSASSSEPPIDQPVAQVLELSHFRKKKT